LLAEYFGYCQLSMIKRLDRDEVGFDVVDDAPPTIAFMALAQLGHFFPGIA
jgi:hypothetical protein